MGGGYLVIAKSLQQPLPVAEGGEVGKTLPQNGEGVWPTERSKHIVTFAMSVRYPYISSYGASDPSQAHPSVLVLHSGLEGPSINTTASGELVVGFSGIGPNPSNASPPAVREEAGA